MCGSPGADTFPLNQSLLVARTETFEKGTYCNFSPFRLKHIFPKPKQWLLAYYYRQPPSTLGLSNIGLGLYLDG